MTKIEHANICRGTLVENAIARYRVDERIGRKLVLTRVTPCASAPLCVIVPESLRNEWVVVKGE
jgi:hypothetical protein